MNNYCKSISLSSLIYGCILLWLPLTEYLIIIDTKCVLNKTTEIINTLQIIDLISYVYAIVLSLNTYILLIIITSRHIIHGC